MADTIRIGMLGNRGWSIEGKFTLLNPNYLPVDVTKSQATTFTASYMGVDYIFPISDLVLFLDRSYQFIPYASSLVVEPTKDYMKVGDSQTVKVRMRYSNGLDKLLDFEDAGVSSSNPNILKVEDVEGLITLTALSKGEAIIRFSAGTNFVTSRPIIVLDIEEELFAQSKFVGQFPNGIN